MILASGGPCLSLSLRKNRSVSQDEHFVFPMACYALTWRSLIYLQFSFPFFTQSTANRPQCPTPSLAQYITDSRLCHSPCSGGPPRSPSQNAWLDFFFVWILGVCEASVGGGFASSVIIGIVKNRHSDC